MDFLSIQDAISRDATGIFSKVLAILPNITISLILILIGIFVMQIVKAFFVKLSHRMFFHKLSDKIGLSRLLGKMKIYSPPSVIIGKFLGGYFFTFFSLQATKRLGLEAISDFISKLINYIPNVIVALFVVLIGFEISRTVSAVTESALNILEAGAAHVLAVVARGIIILFSILAALMQIDVINQELIKILFTGIVAMIAISGGLSIGLGSKDFVSSLLKDVINKKNKKKST